MTRLKTILILCTGNACRSQLAEAIVNHDLAGQVRALSAGIDPQPKVADNAIQALKLAGLPTEGLHPKSIDAVIDEPFDLVLTVCNHAKESCALFPRLVPHIHIAFDDPHGKDLESFITVFDDIRSRLIPAVRQALGLPYVASMQSLLNEGNPKPPSQAIEERKKRWRG